MQSCIKKVQECIVRLSIEAWMILIYKSDQRRINSYSAKFILSKIVTVCLQLMRRTRTERIMCIYCKYSTSSKTEDSM